MNRAAPAGPSLGHRRAIPVYLSLSNRYQGGDISIAKFFEAERTHVEQRNPDA
jgi:hypothetical protein